MDDYISRYMGKPINKKSDCIRREDVYSLLENINYIVRDEKYGDCFKKIERCIEKLPAADVAPIRYGHWIHTIEDPLENEYDDCSICGYRTIWGGIISSIAQLVAQ